LRHLFCPLFIPFVSWGAQSGPFELSLLGGTALLDKVFDDGQWRADGPRDILNGGVTLFTFEGCIIFPMRDESFQVLALMPR
jgi:hypothetical protein